MTTEAHKSAKEYIPLIAILGVITLTSAALASHFDADIMPIFMGLFLIIFAMFKLVDLDGFAHGFSLYDEVTKRFPAYAKIYPVIELALGLLYLSGLFPVLTSLITIVVMSLGAWGVLKALHSGLNVKCSCLGTAINLSLSTVSLVENLGMITMAVAGLARRFM